MGENEKLGFTCEEVPLDFRTFNRFFGTTTDWVDEGSSVVPKVPRDNLYPPMSPSPLKDDTQVWNGSQRPNVGNYLEVGEFPPKGTEIIPKEEFMKELGVKPHKLKFDIPNCKVSYKDGHIVVDELTELSKDDFKRLSEETAKAFEKSCINYCETLSDVSKSLNPCLDRLIARLTKPTKRKKHYKPKFTL